MGKRLIVNTALMTSASLLMHCIAMGFQGYLSGRIGAAGIGLYQLVMSVELLASTFAISGIRFAVTRLVSEELGMGRAGGVHGAMVRSALYALIFGSAAMLLLTRFAEPVGFLWIGDARTVMSLRILAFGLPCLALSSVISGYFTACGRIWKPSLVHLIEQCAVVVFVALFLERAPEGDIELSCAAVCAGVTASDMLSLALMLAFYLGDRRKYGSRTGESIRLTGRMLSVALPLAVSAYARSALSTLEHLLVPRGFRKSGLSADAALAGYGVIQGMAMPVLSFPSCLLSSLAENVIPELTGAQVRGEREKIRREVRSLLTMSLLFAIAVAFALFVTSDFIGSALFASSEAGKYIRLLAPLIPAMYVDMVVDGCLKGLGQQVWSMGINILDAGLGVLLVYTLLPIGALDAYIGIIYFNELLNLALSAARLRRAVK
ncbi:MAG TPA: oligosaccharide flippase family protein [Candidatus Scatomorpha gallistercoris]|nr:oligosaccharide flippase family protein [Candidatus Scatomorpha gallistercoris]